MSKWTIQVYRPKDKIKWRNVKMSIDIEWRRSTGIGDSKVDFTPRSLEECITVLRGWYEEIAEKNFKTDEGEYSSEWTYRIKRLRSRESIPGDLIK